TPHLYRASPEGRARAAALESLSLTVDVCLHTFERNTSPGYSVGLNGGNFCFGQWPILAGLQRRVQANIPHAFPVERGHPIANRMEHSFYLVIAAFVNGHPGVALAQFFYLGGRGS